MKPKIPKSAKRVFKGVMFDVYHWDQEMFDGSIETYEMIKRIPSVQVIATKGNKLILLKEEQPHIGKFTSVVGGQVERGDTPEETVYKELLEEVGMKPKKIKLWKEVTLGSKIEWESYYYIARGCEKIGDQRLESGEKIEPYEVTFDEFIEETQRKDFRNTHFQNEVFRMIHTKGELERFKKEIFG